MKICDLHNDFLTYFKNNKDRISYINKINKDKNIIKICAVIWTSKFKNPVRFIKNLERNVFKKVDCKKLLICIEDLGFINKSNFTSCIRFLKHLKPFYCGLTWNFDNSLGGGAFGKRRLTELGKKVVGELEKEGILIDTAHMNRKTFSDFCKITSKRIFNSHSNINYIFSHKRNLTNTQIKKICKSNGLFSLSFVNSFISNKKISSLDIAKQIAFCLKKFNKNNIAIGTDFFGTKKLPEDVKDYNQIKNLVKHLKKYGIFKKDINAVFYKNFLNFYKK